jgi:hypothetical protein
MVTVLAAPESPVAVAALNISVIHNSTDAYALKVVAAA